MVSVGGGERNGRRSLNMEVNLVPFIDLLSACICFLLVCAVWIQMQSLPIKQSHGTEGMDSGGPLFNLVVTFQNKGKLSLQFMKNGKTLRSASVQGDSIEKMENALNSSLDAILAGERSNQGNLVGSVAITPANGVSYLELVRVVDLMRQRHIVNIGISPG